ncbi:hypothetical protein ACRCLU_08955 [Klebsiella pneumoniae]|uniref:hypothetical protein n=1 Tax=Klebsiella pneumoniae TaxID=573 RepID=UPI003D9829CB
MKERGMIFNGEMVRALLDGRKTQTRRIMKVQPSEDFTPMNMALETDYKARWYTPGVVDKDGYLQPASKEIFGVSNENEGYSCPFGAVGDRIWVREAYRFPASLDDVSPTGVGEMAVATGYRKPWAPTFYEFTGTFSDGWKGFETPPKVSGAGKLRPSIHMPRWASRILLEITDVRVERLNAISEDDAQREGVYTEVWDQTVVARNYASRDEFFQFWSEDMPHYVEMNQLYGSSFRSLWESIYGAENWLANPWVWVIEFKRVEGGAA